MANTSLAHPDRDTETLRRARVFALREAEDRYRHELMDEERLMLRERILRLKKALAASQARERA